MKKLSLITACFNSAATISDTLKSVNNQTYSNIEHIVVDGGSTDATMEIVATFGERVSQSVSEKDRGIYDAYNKGLNLSSGEIVGFINSDDYYFSNEVAEKVMTIFEDSSIDACHANLVYVDPVDSRKVQRVWKSWNFERSDMERGSIPAHPTVFVRRTVYEQFGNFNLKYKLVADYDFLLRVFYMQKINSVYIDDIWVRMRSGGATGGNLKSILSQNREIREAQKNNGINSSIIVFCLVKLFNRITQLVKSRKFKSDKWVRGDSVD